jgi:hypothetical protein
MRLLSKYVLAPALAVLMASPALAQRSSPPTASQITPSRLEAPLYRTPDVARSLEVNRDQVGQVGPMTNRLQTRSLGELDRSNRLDEPTRDVRRLEAVSAPVEDWRLRLNVEQRLRLANLTSRYNHAAENIPATGRLRKEDNLTSWRDYMGQTRMQVNDIFEVPPPSLNGPTPAPGGTRR